jgi:hypothetical protein
MDEPDEPPPPPPPPIMMPDDLIPGDPPEGLEMEACAVDTNKLFELANSDGIVGDTRLAVDLIGSEFGMVYVDTSDECFDAVYVAHVSGPSGSGAPELDLALDACSQIGRTALAHNNSDWLLATVDDRGGPMDVWIQKLGDTSGADAVRVSDTPREEIDLAIMAARPIVDSDEYTTQTDLGRSGWAAVAWTEQSSSSATHALYLQLLDVDGMPSAMLQQIYEPGSYEFTSLALARVGEDLLGLGYRRFTRMGVSEVVFEVREAATGELVRDPWVLTVEGGLQGTIEIASDEFGGGIVYSIEQGTEGRQIWYQRIDETGVAAPVESGINQGGPSEPLRIVGLPYKGVDASITKLLRGYVIAFRVLPAGPVARSQIRVQFLDRFGRLIELPSTVAYAADEGGRTSIEAAYDGRISVGWTDATEDLSATTVHVVRLPCVR